MEWFLGTMIFILGACVGSFVNMWVYRTAESYGITNSKLRIKDKNRSFCDFCGQQLRWYENIPILSWMILRGRTRCCQKKLPLAYPIVEATTGILFLLLTFKLPLFSVELIIGWILVALLMYSLVFDGRYMILPDLSTVLLIVGGLVLWLLKKGWPDWQFIIAAGVAGGLLLSLNLLTKGRGMGIGDAKYAIFMGILLGLPKTVIALYFAFISGAVIGVVMILGRKLKKSSVMPFGPFLIGGTMAAWWWGDSLIKFIMAKF